MSKKAFARAPAECRAAAAAAAPAPHILRPQVVQQLSQDPAADYLEEEHVLCIASMEQKELGSMAQACNGIRTLREVADRVGWPLRQARLTALRALRAALGSHLWQHGWVCGLVCG